MREIVYKVYTFEELSEESKKKAIEVVRGKGWNTDFVSEDLYEIFRDTLLNFGFNDDVVIEFSLSCCQGDGVAFYGSINFDKWIKTNEDKFTPKELKRLKWLWSENGFNISVERNTYGYHYSHYNTMNIYVILDYYKSYRGEELILNDTNKLEDIIAKQVRELSQELEKEGYAELDYRDSDESIIELIVANEDEFYEDGRLF